MLILITDDDAGIRDALSHALKGHEIIQCSTGIEALATLEKQTVDLVITDCQMPNMTGIELIQTAKKLYPATTFLLMTAFGTIEDAIKAMKVGAEDYLTKPFDLTELRHRIGRIEDLRSWRAEKSLKVESEVGISQIIGKSNFTIQAKQFVKQVASAPSPVLLLGPSGAGKEIIAKSIHEVGNRSLRPFIAVNCASFSEQLMESELFGHEKGAFTGAATAKPGKFELANGGTLFLDEIGELSPSLQAKLLRVLQEKEFFRVGGVKLIKSNARVITATHRPIKQMVKEGSFREDLFFRLNVLSFELLPLNKRKEDIPVLINHFWEKLCAEFGKKLTLSDEVLEALVKYDYPGNVREMKNVLERLVVLSTESAKIDLDLLPKEFHSFSVPKVNTMNNPSKHMQFGPNSSLTELTGKFEAQIITDAMIQTNNNQVKASKLLGITRGALQYKLKKYEIDVTQNSLAKKEAA